ncbi:hypothetical protein [Pediococcus acidilactici]|uniref:Uncharacterized protein n=1 Tax=Pediococcus acidilactici DSM 20284 TaxID=862514 RepID=E0NDD8_PEDAC|nr:hypothetical protein [Pediococcus acidilactici]AZP90637.1 hypothetical protein CYD95_04480 [Pediococcus acidilactici]EFL96259.1 hypothetical protein HMPREF0623_0310 [Pediococcus acidilactici DSM 20284]KRN17169.1 hypothetical protein IV78_GL000255 [Pediococcus acidilactici]MDG9739610.1 hypothetical protein [Pediococcus acidilactici]NKZ16092.1 hypothetical protein [Pediococcus acidilactici]
MLFTVIPLDSFKNISSIISIDFVKNVSLIISTLVSISSILRFLYNKFLSKPDFGIIAQQPLGWSKGVDVVCVVNNGARTKNPPKIEFFAETRFSCQVKEISGRIEDEEVHFPIHQISKGYVLTNKNKGVIAKVTQHQSTDVFTQFEYYSNEDYINQFKKDYRMYIGENISCNKKLESAPNVLLKSNPWTIVYVAKITYNPNRIFSKDKIAYIQLNQKLNEANNSKPSNESYFKIVKEKNDLQPHPEDAINIWSSDTKSPYLAKCQQQVIEHIAFRNSTQSN